MKYDKLVLEKILNDKEWKSTAKIKRETELSAKKSINWYTIYYLLENLLKEKKVEKIESDNVVLWRRIAKNR